MITRELLEEYLDDDTRTDSSRREEGIDYAVEAIKLLRERIPYDECRYIIEGADNNGELYLANIDNAIPHLTKEDADFLALCGCWIHEDFCLALFV